MDSIVNLDCISPNKKNSLMYFVNCILEREKMKRIGGDGIKDISNDVKIEIDKAIFIHIIDCDKEINKLSEEYIFKKIGK